MWVKGSMGRVVPAGACSYVCRLGGMSGSRVHGDAAHAPLALHHGTRVDRTISIIRHSFARTWHDTRSPRCFRGAARPATPPAAAPGGRPHPGSMPGSPLCRGAGTVSADRHMAHAAPPARRARRPQTADRHLAAVGHGARPRRVLPRRVKVSSFLETFEIPRLNTETTTYISPYLCRYF